MRCDNPLFLKGVPLPCGKCLVCKTRRVSAWSFRLAKEYERCESAFFLTLTYDTPPMTKNKFMSLKKHDVQVYIKRLRRRNKGRDLKYYCVGEYGGKTGFGRPHYHLIIFNCELLELTQYDDAARTRQVTKRGAVILDGDYKYWSDAWEHGYLTVGECTKASVGYVLDYISKQWRVPMFQADDRQKEFSMMSKRLGDNYLTRQMIKWHKSDLHGRVYAVLPDGGKIALPRYYKNRIYNPMDLERIGKRYERIAAVARFRRTKEQKSDDELQKAGRASRNKERRRISPDFE